MSAKREAAAIEPTEKITLDDIKHHAEGVRDLAITESKRVSAELLETNVTRTLLIAAGVVVVVASFAYMVGSRAGRRRCPEPPY